MRQQVVDVLGGVTSVLYRVGFFDRSRLTDYIHYPSAAFYVDDEWIAAVLEEAGVPRVVLSRSSAPASACLLMEGANVLAYGREGHALNGPAHAHQNMEYQSMVLRCVKIAHDTGGGCNDENDDGGDHSQPGISVKEKGCGLSWRSLVFETRRAS